MRNKRNAIDLKRFPRVNMLTWEERQNRTPECTLQQRELSPKTVEEALAQSKERKQWLVFGEVFS